MEEKETVEIVSKENEKETATSNTDKKSKKQNKKDEKKGPGFIAKHKAEFKKIKWPTRQELIKETVVVIFISLIVGAIIFGVDEVVQIGFSKILSIL